MINLKTKSNLFYNVVVHVVVLPPRFLSCVDIETGAGSQFEVIIFTRNVATA